MEQVFQLKRKNDLYFVISPKAFFLLLKMHPYKNKGIIVLIFYCLLLEDYTTFCEFRNALLSNTLNIGGIPHSSGQ